MNPDVETVRRGLMMRDAGYGEPNHLWEQVGALLKEHDRLRTALDAAVPLSELRKELAENTLKELAKSIALHREAIALARKAESENGPLRDALAPFARYYDLTDCHEWEPDDALEVPISDLERAHRAFAKPEPA